jgi:poly(hydroxyalkanoate) depolymerase family esterase
MKNPFTARALSLNTKAINETIQRALTAAGLNTKSGVMHDVTETIRRHLNSAGLGGGGGVPSAPPHVAPVVDTVARDVDKGQNEGGEPISWPPSDEPHTNGTFQRRSFSNAAGSRSYKLYVPIQRSPQRRPVVVMLHGCTQSADDFAAGTQMNRLADEHDFLVVYPEQAGHANTSRCWNWFKPQDQQRDAGEPSVIAGIVREVVQQYEADTRRVFVAGLSAGAAMAVVLGESYPEVFAGVGAHSGLPYGSAHDIPSALAAMKGGRSGMPGLRPMPGAVTAQNKKAVQAVPTIVFHGDRDTTVQHSNGAEIAKHAEQAYLSQDGEPSLHSSTTQGTALKGRSFTRTVHANPDGQPHIEHWTLHGAGHAWSGGDPRGTYTDHIGPDASAEMVRFFLSLPRGGSA